MPRALDPSLTRLLELCRLDRRWTRGKGVWLFDERGRWFLDGYAQYGAVALGHNAPACVAALRDALAAHQPAMVQPYRGVHAEALAEELIERAPGDLAHVVFTTSGSASVEAAVKLVRANTGRPLIVTARGGYHGKTLGTLALHPESRHASGFGPLGPGTRCVEWGDAEALAACLAAHPGQVAGVLLEPVLGEGGVHPAPAGYLRAARELCDRHGAALILDEVQTGLGRTGALFACEREQVAPDVLCLAKALSGGLVPLGACLASERFWSARFGLGHGSTFANNELACAVGRAVLGALDEELLSEVERKGAWLLEQLEALARRHPRWIRAARGQGLLTALELQVPGEELSDLLSLLAHHGLYAYAVAGAIARCASLLVLPTLGPTPVLRIAPPLTIAQAELELLVAGLRGVFDALEQQGVGLLLGALGDPPAAPATPATRPLPAEPVQLPAPPRPERLDYLFVAHLTGREDVRVNNPGLELDEPQLDQACELLARLPASLVCRGPRLSDAAGEPLEGAVVLLPLLPEGLRRLGARAACRRIEQAVELGVSLGARVIGLGGHTTPFSRHGEAVVGRGARITTGNAFTAHCALAGVEARLAARGQRLAELEAPLAVLGAGGSVGSLCARLAARAGAPRLLLLGNPRSGTARLERLAEDLRERYGREVVVDRDPRRLAGAGVVLAATASKGGALGKAPLMSGALICDLARPPDATSALRARRDLELFTGGLVALPNPSARFGAGNLVGLPSGIQLACLAETILLACEEQGPDHVGRDLSLELVDRVAALAARHGLRPHLGSEPARRPVLSQLLAS